ncbi:MAG: hypothetical protein MUF72_00185 [Elainella sp. Prado103]|jgi:hypothetical protein|nr:hypothetical protein [Elainella sp. Prado103]
MALLWGKKTVEQFGSLDSAFSRSIVWQHRKMVEQFASFSVVAQSNLVIKRLNNSSKLYPKQLSNAAF